MFTLTRKRIIASSAGAIAAVGLATTLVLTSSSTGAAGTTDATCAQPSYDGTNFTISCVIPRASATSTETVTTTATATVIETPAGSSTPTPTPSATSTTPSATPTPTTPPGGFPNASNTGPAAAGCTSFTAKTGNQTITASGTYAGWDIAGSLTINAPNVTISCFKVHGNADTLVQVNQGGTHTTIQDSAVYGNANSTAQAPKNGLVQSYADNFTLLRSNLYNSSADGIRISENQNDLIQDNYLHDFVLHPSNSPHMDGIVGGESVSGPWTIRHNTLEMWSPGSTVNVISLVEGDGSRQSRMIVDNNLLAGGGFTIGGGGNTAYVDNEFTNNLFSTKFTSVCGQYGVMDDTPKWGAKAQWSNNRYVNAAGVIGAMIPAP